MPGNELVRIEVRVASKQNRKDLPNTTTDTVTQGKTLHIVLSGKPKIPETRTGKWIVYGHAAKNHDVAVLESGEFKIDLSPNGQQKIETKEVSTTYTREHATVSRSGNGRGSSTRAKQIEATGMKFVGFGIVIKEDEKVVGEAFDPPSMNKEAVK